MKLPLLVLLTLCAAAGPATAPSHDQESAGLWMMTYFHHPAPEQFEDQMHRLASNGLLHKEGAEVPTWAFFARLMADNPARLEDWSEAIRNLDPRDQPVMIKALHEADTDASKKCFAAILKGNDDTARLAAVIKDETPTHFDQLKPSDLSPELLDGCWGSFFATGDGKYASVVFHEAIVPAPANTVDLTQASADWSARALCRQDPAVLQSLTKCIDQASETDKPKLKALLPPATPATAPAGSR